MIETSEIIPFNKRMWKVCVVGEESDELYGHVVELLAAEGAWYNRRMMWVLNEGQLTIHVTGEDEYGVAYDFTFGARDFA